MIDKKEKDFVDKIENIFKSCGFQTSREVVPNECKTWAQPYRIDLICFRSDIGYIGIEAKVINTLGQGSVFRDAAEQIKKYRELTYFENIKITRWVIFPDFKIDTWYDTHRAFLFLQGFFERDNIELAYAGENINISPNKTYCLNLEKQFSKETH